jgi:hypothetical protein
MPKQLTDELIDAAIEGYQQRRARIDQKIEEVRAMRSGNQIAAQTTKPAGRRRMSTAARARIAAAQRARWAKGEAEPAPPAKKKRRMSEEGRARIMAATKARWARVRAEKARRRGITGKKLLSSGLVESAPFN